VEFIISYAPTEYGTDKHGRLVVHTEMQQWVFEVVGMSPEYHAPAGVSRVDTRLPGDVEASLRAARDKPKRNVVRENLRPINKAKGK
jgi:hypothetical protein